MLRPWIIGSSVNLGREMLSWQRKETFRHFYFLFFHLFLFFSMFGRVMKPKALSVASVLCATRRAGGACGEDFLSCGCSESTSNVFFATVLNVDTVSGRWIQKIQKCSWE